MAVDPDPFPGTYATPQKWGKQLVLLLLLVSISPSVASDEGKGYKKETIKSFWHHVHDTIYMVNTYDRPADASVEGTYAETGTYMAGTFAEAGVGRACVEFSVFEAEVKGPSVSARAEASVVKVGAMARAEVASVSAKAGPVGVKVALGFDMGASIGLTGIEYKFLGNGFSVGLKSSITFLGSEVSYAYHWTDIYKLMTTN